MNSLSCVIFDLPMGCDPGRRCLAGGGQPVRFLRSFQAVIREGTGHAVVSFCSSATGEAGGQVRLPGKLADGTG